MLPKANRLPSSEIRNVLRRGTRISNASMQFVFLPNQAKAPRFAFVISTNIGKRAVDRNRMKRMLRDSIRSQLHRFQNPIDAVLIVRKRFHTQSTVDIDKEIQAVFLRAHILGAHQ